MPATAPSRYTLSRPRGWGIASKTCPRSCLIRMIDFPELPLHSGVREVLDSRKDGVSVRTRISFGIFNRDIDYTRIERPRRAAFLLRRTVNRSCKLLDRLRLSGIAIPEPVFAVIPSGSAGDLYFATEWVGGTPLREMIHQHAASRQQVAAIGGAVGRLLGELRKAGWAPRKLGIDDLMLKQSESSPTGYRAWLRRAMTADSITSAGIESHMIEIASTLAAGIANPETALLRLVDAYFDACGESMLTRARRTDELLQAVLSTAHESLCPSLP